MSRPYKETGFCPGRPPEKRPRAEWFRPAEDKRTRLHSPSAPPSATHFWRLGYNLVTRKEKPVPGWVKSPTLSSR